MWTAINVNIKGEKQNIEGRKLAFLTNAFFNKLYCKSWHQCVYVETNHISTAAPCASGSCYRLSESASIQIMTYNHLSQKSQ